MTTLQKTNIKVFFEKAIQNTKLDIQKETLLQKIANKIVIVLNTADEVNINFVCTHNAKQSQFAQAWAFYAMQYFDIKNGYSFSSGTTTSCFHNNTLKALEKAGFKFSLEEFNHQNPKYILSHSDSNNGLLVFSKLIDHPVNKSPFIAISMSIEANEICLTISEAIDCFHLPIEDPRSSDAEENIKDTYIKNCTLIAGEIGMLFKMVKKRLE